MLLIRELSENDSLEELTGLVRKAYQPLADLGFKYLGARQTVVITRSRIAKGQCYVALKDSLLIGTILLSTPPNKPPHPWYDREDVATFHQFAVDPAFQKMGVGSALLEFIEERARDSGCAELSCSTSEGATHLIEMYKKRGFRPVAAVDWPEADSLSLILSKSL